MATYMYYFIVLLLLFTKYDDVVTSASSSSFSSNNYNNIRPMLMHRNGKLTPVPSVNDSLSSPIITIVTSPNVPSLLVESTSNAAAAVAGGGDDDVPLFLLDDRILVCRGATLATSISSSATSSTDENTMNSSSSSTTTNHICLSVCGTLSDVIVLEGIAMSDITDNSNNKGILNTRHATTLSHLFRSKHQQQLMDVETDTTTRTKRQTLILMITTATEASKNDNGIYDTTKLIQDLRTLYQVVQEETNDSSNNNKKMKFDDIYDVQIIPISSSSNGSKVLSDIISSSSSETVSDSEPLSISDALRTVLRNKSSLNDEVFVTPYEANVISVISTASMKQSRTVRAKAAAWKSRIARGLVIDGFGKEATELRNRILDWYDAETIAGAGIAIAAPYRYEMRQQLQVLLDTSIQQSFTGQVSNLEKLTVRRFNSELLQTVDNNSNTSAESTLGNNAATLRKEALLFESVMEDLEVPMLGLVKDKPIRDLATKLNNALNAFPDSPAAKLKRLQQVTKVVNKEKQPGQRSVSFGLDLVAMLRPDGFGSLQGFAGYQLPGGNSVTFGVHNDADDPQVIAQFGGVRPPLLRVQPKLRVDVEM